MMVKLKNQKISLSPLFCRKKLISQTFETDVISNYVRMCTCVPTYIETIQNKFLKVCMNNF